MKAGFYSRRRVLGGLAASTALLPLLESNRAAGATYPRRLLIVMNSQGVVRDSFWPKGGDGTDLTTMTFPEAAAPLEPYRSDLLFVRGLTARNYTDATGIAFHCGHGTYNILFTGTRAGAISSTSKYVRATSMSIDQFIADDLAKRATLPFRSLNLGLLRNIDPCFYRGPDAPIKAEIDPQRVAAGFFSGLTNNNAMNLNRIRAERRSILDFVGQDIARFTARIAVEDRLKVENHLQSVRDIEKQTAGMADVKCVAPTVPKGDSAFVKNTANYPALMNAQMDLITAAFKCDLTRVATLQMGDSNGDGLSFPWLGFGGYHSIAHQSDGPGGVDFSNGQAGPYRKIKTDLWYMQQFAGLIKRFKSVPEPGGSMLDNTAIVFTSNMGSGKEHDWSDLPVIIAGSCGNYFKTGRNLVTAPLIASNPNNMPSPADRESRSRKSTPMNGLYVGLANAMGVPITTFGDAAYGTGPLPRLNG